LNCSLILPDITGKIKLKLLKKFYNFILLTLEIRVGGNLFLLLKFIKCYIIQYKTIKELGGKK